MDFDPGDRFKLTIGRLARASGLSLTTIRYYQRRGLLRLPERSPAGSFRIYTAEDLERLRLIRKAQKLGFTLSEIALLIRFTEQHDCQALKLLLESKLEAVGNEIKLLIGIRSTLERLAENFPPSDCGRCSFFG